MNPALLRRSLLYDTFVCNLTPTLLTHKVPGSSKRFLDWSGAFNTGCTVYDLEDSVTLANKDTVHLMVVSALHRRGPNSRERGVRINSVGSGLALVDLRRILRCENLTTIVVPKVDCASDMSFVRDVIQHERPKGLRPVAVIA